MKKGKTMKRARAYLSFAFGALFVALAWISLSLVWHVIAQRIGSTKDIWDIATAAGTCGAVIAALWISGKESRRRKQDAELDASIMAVRLVEPLKRSLMECSLFESEARQWLPWPELNADRYAKLVANIDRAIFPVTNADLRALNPLAGRCGHRIGRALAILAKIKVDLEKERENFFYEHATRARDNSLRAWIKEAEEAADYLRIAYGRCSVSALYDVLRTPEEQSTFDLIKSDLPPRVSDVRRTR